MFLKTCKNMFLKTFYNFKSSTFLQQHILYLNVDFHVTICAAVKVLAIFSDPEFSFTVEATLFLLISAFHSPLAE